MKKRVRAVSLKKHLEADLKTPEAVMHFLLASYMKGRPDLFWSALKDVMEANKRRFDLPSVTL